MKKPGAMTFGHIVIEPKRVSDSSVWIGQPREGFTAYMAKALNAPVKVNEVGDRIVVQRQHLMSTLIGLGQNRQTEGLRHANVVGKN